MIALLLSAVTANVPAWSQAAQLTAEQRRMIDALPPAQRQQALDALRRTQDDNASTGLKPVSEHGSSAIADAAGPALSAFAEDEEPRADAGSRLVITFTPKQTLTTREVESIRDDRFLGRLVGTRAYVLSDTGMLSLMDVEFVPVLGLTEKDIERRLSAEPYLAQFNIDVRILEERLTGVEALEPFGYDLFETAGGELEPPTTGPVPPDYVLGPGDTVRVQLFGNVNSVYEYDVTRDGILNLPEIGPVTVAGIPFSEFRADLNKRVAATMIGTQVSVTMGSLKSIRVFVLGDVNRPGSYIVGGLATVSNALYRSGGISGVGTLRDVQLKRQGQIVARLDLYDLLLRGDTSNDLRLLPGDVIFVPPIGRTISVAGAVKRPAIYEVSDTATIAQSVALAGGLAPDAFAAGARVERIGADLTRHVIGVDLGGDEARRLTVRAGDVLTVPTILPELADTVIVSGHVHRPGPHPYRPGLRLTDVIPSPDELKAGVDDNYVLIRRERAPGMPVEMLSADLEAAIRNPGSADNVPLASRDTIYVFSLAFGRQRVIEPLLDELQLQATHDQPFQQVQIAGNVRAPGAYPLEPGMRLDDLIRAGGSLTEDAYTLNAELTRYTSSDSGRTTELIEVDLGALLRGDAAANLELEPYDHLSITRVPDWESTWSVRVQGEVRFPGEYRIRRGETLASVLERAGGLSDEAFAEGAVFLRESLRRQEQEQLDTLIRRLEADLASLSLEAVDTTGSDTLATGRVLLQQLRETEAVGRLVIDVDYDRGTKSMFDFAASLELRDEDRLLVPAKSQVVTVIGETQQNTSHVYQPGLSRDDYIEMSGGLTRRADRKLIYVVRASGAVIAGNRSRWLGRGSNVNIRPGDTIVVPLETDRIRPLTFWTNVTQILYQGAIAVAAIRSFDN